MASSHLPTAFLSSTTATTRANDLRLKPIRKCATRSHPCNYRPRPHVAVPSMSDPRASSSSQEKIARAAFVAAAASILATGVPTSFDHLPSVDLSALGIPAAHATGRGGGASFSSASGDVIKDPEALLRWSLPIQNKSVRVLQQELETAVNELRGLKWSNVDSHVKKAVMVLNKQGDQILASVPAGRQEEASSLLSRVSEKVNQVVEPAVVEKNAEKLTRACRDVLRDIGAIEQSMVTQFPYEVPSEFSNLPVLKGRATVELVVRKGGDEQFDINGTFYKEGKMTLVLDGYSAPVSAGNFIDLVNQGFYNGIDILRSDGFIVQSGKPKKGDGYVDSSGVVRTIPLEVFAKGDKMPTYGITLEEDGRGAERTVLPFTSYGTLAVARNESEANSASSQFFWFLFEPDLTPAGRNLMDGNWAVMGYTTSGEEYLRSLQKGDEIVSAKVVQGIENLKKST